MEPVHEIPPKRQIARHPMEILLRLVRATVAWWPPRPHGANGGPDCPRAWRPCPLPGVNANSSRYRLFSSATGHPVPDHADRPKSVSATWGTPSPPAPLGFSLYLLGETRQRIPVEIRCRYRKRRDASYRQL